MTDIAEDVPEDVRKFADRMLTEWFPDLSLGDRPTSPRNRRLAFAVALILADRRSRDATAGKMAWRCFHCGQVFTDYHVAQAHFGKASTDDPECLKELHRLGPHLLEIRRDRNRARSALKTALDHIEHMAAWTGKQDAGYSFESLGEDMPGMREALYSESVDFVQTKGPTP